MNKQTRVSKIKDNKSYSIVMEQYTSLRKIFHWYTFVVQEISGGV